MKLVESEIPTRDTHAPHPHRPPRRRVSVSFVLTLTILAAIVATVYGAFPRRDNELMDVALAGFKAGEPAAIVSPSNSELKAWALGAMGHEITWPWKGEQVEVLGASTFVQFRRNALRIQLRRDDVEFGLFVFPTRDVVRRKATRIDGGVAGRSWRYKRWTFVAVGPADRFADWRGWMGAP